MDDKDRSKKWDGRIKTRVGELVESVQHSSTCLDAKCEKDTQNELDALYSYKHLVALNEKTTKGKRDYEEQVAD